MPEVISLLSSPPISPARVAARPFSRLSPSALFGLDDFDSTGDIEFPNEQAAKRRKVSTPNYQRPLPKGVRNSVLAALDLSSEPDLPPSASTNPFPRRAGLANAELDLSSDHDCPSSSAPAKTSAYLNRLLGPTDVDDIEFSSSAPVRAKGKSPKAKQVVHVLSSDDSNEGDVLDSLNVRARSPVFSSRVMKVLASTKTQTNYEAKSAQRLPKMPPTSKRNSKSGPILEDDIVVSSPPKATNKKQTDKPRRINADQDEQRAAAKGARVAAKEAEKQRKKEEKLEREKEKQKAKDLADVNKSKASKKETAKEMILQMPASIEGTSVGNQVEEYMRQHEVEFSFRREEVNLPGDRDAYPGKVIDWKRKIEATYDEDEGHWIPLTRPRVEPVDHVAVMISGQEFAKIAIGTQINDSDPTPDLELMKYNLDQHVDHIRRRYKNRRLIYLVQGLHAWVKKNETTKNREYTAAVRAQAVAEAGTGPPTASQARRKKQAKDSPLLPAITADAVEDLQLYLQVNHQPLVIHHTASHTETASQILSFTQSLSSRPYRIAELDHNLKSASFFMGTGSYRTGDGAEETFRRMLECQQRVTPSIAQSIASQWSSPRELVHAFRVSDNLMLEDVRKSTNKDGGYSDRRIGPVISKRMYKVFLGRNPEATDGMS